MTVIREMPGFIHLLQSIIILLFYPVSDIYLPYGGQVVDMVMLVNDDKDHDEKNHVCL